jgi:hypothetical protein
MYNRITLKGLIINIPENESQKLRTYYDEIKSKLCWRKDKKNFNFAHG